MREPFTVSGTWVQLNGKSIGACVNAGEARSIAKSANAALRHKRFACAYCGRGMPEAVTLLRVNKLGDTPAIWICRDHFNYTDFKNAR